jgi:hypothetical protein
MVAFTSEVLDPMDHDIVGKLRGAVGLQPPRSSAVIDSK